MSGIRLVEDDADTETETAADEVHQLVLEVTDCIWDGGSVWVWEGAITVDSGAPLPSRLELRPGWQTGDVVEGVGTFVAELTSHSGLFRLSLDLAGVEVHNEHYESMRQFVLDNGEAVAEGSCWLGMAGRQLVVDDDLSTSFAPWKIVR